MCCILCNKSDTEDIYKIEIVNILFSGQIYKYKKKSKISKIQTMAIGLFNSLHPVILNSLYYHDYIGPSI